MCMSCGAPVHEVCIGPHLIPELGDPSIMQLHGMLFALACRRMIDLGIASDV